MPFGIPKECLAYFRILFTFQQRQLDEDRQKLRQEREQFKQKIEAIEKLGSGASHIMNGSD